MRDPFRYPLFRKQSDRPAPPPTKRKSSHPPYRVSDRRASSQKEPERPHGRCTTGGHRPRATYLPRMQTASPSLRETSCDGIGIDPVEWAIEEHVKLLPASIDDPGFFSTAHDYRFRGARIALRVSTVCLGKRLETFVHRPGESLTVFGLHL